jgi:hypothetical protein
VDRQVWIFVSVAYLDQAVAVTVCRVGRQKRSCLPAPFSVKVLTIGHGIGQVTVLFRTCLVHMNKRRTDFDGNDNGRIQLSLRVNETKYASHLRQNTIATAQSL